MSQFVDMQVMGISAAGKHPVCPDIYEIDLEVAVLMKPELSCLRLILATTDLKKLASILKSDPEGV